MNLERQIEQARIRLGVYVDDLAHHAQNEIAIHASHVRAQFKKSIESRTRSDAQKRRFGK